MIILLLVLSYVTYITNYNTFIFFALDYIVWGVLIHFQPILLH